MSSSTAETITPGLILPEKYYNAKQTAELLCCSIEKLATYRSKGLPPEYIKWGGSIRYKGEDLIACLEGYRRTSTSG